MENDKQEIIDSINDTEETVNEESELDFEIDDDAEETNEVDVEELRKKVQTLEAQKNHWKKKANAGKESESKPTVNTKELSPTELYTLMKSDVAPEDLEVVTKYAGYEGISVAQALKSDVLKTILDKRTQARKTAEATSTGSTRKSTNQTSPEALLENAKKGNLPDSDADLEKLVNARWTK